MDLSEVFTIGCINIKQAEVNVVLCFSVCLLYRWASSLYPSTWTNGHERFSADAGRRGSSQTCKSQTNTNTLKLQINILSQSQIFV